MSSESTSDPSPSARSQVLGNPDLLELIFSFFHVPPDDLGVDCRIATPDSQHLVWASLACKTFFVPAINILWQHLDSWLALLQLIPTLSFVGGENFYTTTGVILDEQIERLNFYACRIRHLKITAFKQSVSTHIYAAISRHQHKLFPTLRTLILPALGQLHRDNLNALLLIPTSTLSFVSLGGITPSTEVVAASLLLTIASEARCLVRLHVSGQLSNVTLDILHSFNTLKALKLDVQNTIIRGGVIEKITTLGKLHSLLLTLDANSSFDCPSKLTATFAELRSLEIAGPAELVLAILRVMYITHLADVKFKFTGLGSNVTVSTVRESIEAFIQPQIASSVQSILLDVARDIPLPWKTIIPLHSCQHLRHLKISIDYLNAARLLRLCNSGEWKRLETLWLACNRVKPGEKGLSLYDLRIFSDHCPALMQLSISLQNITQDHNGEIWLMRKEGMDRSFWSDHRLKFLRLLSLESRPTDLMNEASKKTIKDAVAVSQYIHSIFPYLNELLYPVAHDWLDGVEDMLKVFRAIRKTDESPAVVVL